ncbi:MAG: hypothetical protein IKA64_03150 [Clostridia bacterium]|nr:hypothetical protein [Clostridia bacterium]
MKQRNKIVKAPREDGREETRTEGIVVMNTDICVVCGAVVPEGRIICRMCECELEEE